MNDLKTRLGLSILLAGLAPWQARADDREASSCPGGASQVSSTAGMTYLGFRWVRRDGSTCSAEGLDQTLYSDPVTRQVTRNGSETLAASLEFDLVSKLYRVRRRFYVGEAGHYVTEVETPGYYRTVPGTPGYYETIPGTPGYYETHPGTPGYYETVSGTPGYYETHPGTPGHYDSDGYWIDGTPDTQVWVPGTPDTQVWHAGTPDTQVWVPGTSDTQVWHDGTPDTQVWVPEVTRQVWVDDGPRNYYSDSNDDTGDVNTTHVHVDFAGMATHPVYPWEKETFTVTVNGGDVTAGVVDATYRYQVTTVLDDSDSGLKAAVTVVPGERIRTPIDPSAVAGTIGLSDDGRRLTLKLDDKWAPYYEGTTIEVSLKIDKKRGFWLPDTKVFEGTFRVADAPNMAQDLDALALKERLQAGASYDVSFKWRRPDSAISTDEWSGVTTLPQTKLSPAAVAQTLAAAAGPTDLR